MKNGIAESACFADPEKNVDAELRRISFVLIGISITLSAIGLGSDSRVILIGAAFLLGWTQLVGL